MLDGIFFCGVREDACIMASWSEELLNTACGWNKTNSLKNEKQEGRFPEHQGF